MAVKQIVYVGELNLAPDIIFNEPEHTYHLKGKELSGVTRVINAHLKKKMPEGQMNEVRDEGLHVHRAVQAWINSGCTKVNSIHPGVVWMTSELLAKCSSPPMGLHSEVLVSDQKQYASGVDIAAIVAKHTLDLFDMKRTFDRVSVTWQLSIYKYFIETYTPWKVGKMWCASYREKEFYEIYPRSFADVESLLYHKKGVL